MAILAIPESRHGIVPFIVRLCCGLVSDSYNHCYTLVSFLIAVRALKIKTYREHCFMSHISCICCYTSQNTVMMQALCQCDVTWSWTRQVGTDMRDKLSDEVLISTRQSKSTSLGKKTESTKQSIMRLHYHYTPCSKKRKPPNFWQ